MKEVKYSVVEVRSVAFISVYFIFITYLFRSLFHFHRTIIDYA